MLKEGSYAGGWAAQYNDGKQFLQVDLGNITKVTAVATQGLYEYNWMVTSYTLAYSLDAGSFTPYGDGDGQVRTFSFSFFSLFNIVFITQSIPNVTISPSGICRSLVIFSSDNYKRPTGLSR